MEVINSLICVLDSNPNISTNEIIELLCIFGRKYNTLRKFEELINKLVESNYSSLDKENICTIVNQLIEPYTQEQKFQFKSQISGKNSYKLNQIKDLSPDDLLDISSSCSFSLDNSSQKLEWICRFAKVNSNTTNECAIEVNIY